MAEKGFKSLFGLKVQKGDNVKPNKIFTILIVGLMLIQTALVLFPTETVQGASPYQALAGEDYQAIATAKETAIETKAGRATSSLQDGWDTIYDNKTWTHYFNTSSALGGTDHGLVQNGPFTTYKQTNITIADNGILYIPDIYYDNFNDNSIGSEWTKFDIAVHEIKEQFGEIYSEKYTTTTNPNGIHQNSDLMQNYFELDFKDANTSSFAGASISLSLFLDNATLTNTGKITNQEWKKAQIVQWATIPGNTVYIFTYMDNTSASYMKDVGSGVVADEPLWSYDNDTTTWVNETVGGIKYAMSFEARGSDFRGRIEVNATHIIWTLTNLTTGNVSVTANVTLGTIYDGGGRSKVVVGNPTETFYGADYAEGHADNFEMDWEPGEAWYTSPVIPCGHNNSVFEKLIWSGNDTLSGDMTAQIRTARSPTVGWSAWHTVEQNTSFLASGWNGSYMQFNFTWNDMNSTVWDIEFQHYGSNTGIVWNGSAEWVIDRYTRWYGFNLSMDHGLNITHPSASGNNGYAFRLENCSIQTKNKTIVVTTVPGTVGDSWIFLSNLTINGTVNSTFYDHSFNAGLGWYPAVVNITTTNVSTLTVINDIVGFVSDIDALQVGTHGFYINNTGTTQRVELIGGHKGDADTYFQGIRTRIGYNNFLDYTGEGGGGIVCAVTSSDAYGAEEANISNNVILANTYYGIVGVPDSGLSYGIRNGTAVMYDNIIKGFNYTGGLWSSGIHLREGACNWTVWNNYIYDSDANSVISSPILLWDGTRENTISDNFIWNCSVSAGIFIWKDNENITVEDNFIFDIDEVYYDGWLPFDSFGIVWYNNTATTNVHDHNTIINITGDGVGLYGQNYICGNDTMFGISGYDYNITVNSDANIYGGIHTENFGFEDSANFTYYEQSSFLVVNRKNQNANFVITLEDSNYTYLPANLTSTSGVSDYWLAKARKWNGSSTETVPTYEATVTVPGLRDVVITENDVEIAWTLGSFIFEAGANGTYNITENFVYSDVIQSGQDIFDLIADIGDLLGLNTGSAFASTIVILLFMVMVFIPFAVVVTVVVYAYKMIKSKAKW